MRGFYINFCFKDIAYDESFYSGKFSSLEHDAYCEFHYDRKTGEFRIWNNSLPEEEILPLPIHWLDWKLKQNGELKTIEKKISY